MEQGNKFVNDNLLNYAQMVFEHWFLQFDFLDENGKPYKSSGGALVFDEKLKQRIPKDWISMNIVDVASITWGQCPEGKNILAKDSCGENLMDYCSGAGDMKGGFIVDCQAKTDDSKRVARKDDILLSIAGKIGDMCVVDHDISLGRAAAAFTVNNKKNRMLVYLLLKALNKKITTISTGSIQKVINSDHINDFNFAYNENIADAFGELMDDIFEKLIELSNENRKLADLRDWLLPMLMNGQATIED